MSDHPSFTRAEFSPVLAALASALLLGSNALAQTFTSTDVPYTIGPDDGALTTSVLTVPASSGSITDVNLSIQLDHTWSGDLDISLTSPTGTVVEVWDTSLSNSDFDGTYVFDDEAAGTATAASTIAPGTYQSFLDALSSFDGEVADGTWTLNILDNAGGDAGNLYAWSLIFGLIPASDATGAALTGSIPGFGIQQVQSFLDTTNTHLRSQAMRGPRAQGLAANDQMLRQEVSLAGALDQVRSYSAGWEAWAQVYGEDGDVGTGASSYNYDVVGTAVGADRWINDSTLVGVFAGYSGATMDLDVGGAGLEADTARIGFHGVKRFGKAYLLGSLHYGNADYEADRVTATGAARSDFASDEVSAYLEMGYPMTINASGLLDGVVVQPLVALQYTRVMQDGYTETGAGASNLVVPSQEEDSERASIGVLLTKDFNTRFGILRPYLEGRYTHEFNETNAVVNANFQGGGPVIAQGALPDRDFVEGRIGASLDINESTTLYGGVEGRYSTDTSAHLGFFGVRMGF